MPNKQMSTFVVEEDGVVSGSYDIVDAQARSEITQLKGELNNSSKATGLVFSKTDLVNSGYINTNGAVAAGSAFGYSNIIEIPTATKNIQINRHGNFSGAAIAFYNKGTIAQANFISGVTSPGNVGYNENNIVVDIPNGATHVVFSNRVDTATIYDFEVQINVVLLNYNNIFAQKSDLNELKSELCSIDYTLADDLKTNGYIDEDGNVQSSASWEVSDLIELPSSCSAIYVTKCYPLSGTNLNIAFYDVDKSFISGQQMNVGTGTSGSVDSLTVTKPVAAVYVRFGTHVYTASYHGFVASLILQNIVEDLYTEIDKAKKTNEPRQLISDVFAPLVMGTKNLKIKFVGDSITAGVGGTGFNDGQSGGGDWIYQGYYENISGYCWANLIKTYWESKFNCTVHNFGMSGRKSGHLVNGLSAWLHNDDDIIVCMIGTNDRNLNETDPITGETSTKTTFYNNLHTIVDAVQNAGKKIVLMANIPAYNENNPNFRMEDVDHIVMKVAAEYNMEYVSVYKLMMDYCKYTGTDLRNELLADGLHPNDAGYLVMFRLITNALGISAKREDATW